MQVRQGQAFQSTWVSRASFDRGYLACLSRLDGKCEASTVESNSFVTGTKIGCNFTVFCFCLTPSDGIVIALRVTFLGLNGRIGR